MNAEKLQGLFRLAQDERTPIDEARNAALAYVRNGGTITPNAKDAERIGKLEEERDAARAESAKHKAEAERLRLIIGKMLALKDAEQKLEKAKADVEREAKDALAPARPAKPINPQDFISGYASDWKPPWSPMW
jgi:hypothetical protein